MKRRSWGVTVFGIFLIIAGGLGAISMNPPQFIREITRTINKINRIHYEGAIEAISKAEKSSDKKLLDDIKELKQETSNFKSKYIDKNFAEHNSFLIFYSYFGFFIVLSYPILGFCILRLIPWSRIAIIIATSINCISPLLGILVWSSLMNPVNYLNEMWNAFFQKYNLKPVPSLNNISLGQDAWGAFIIFICYALFVVFFFTRQNVKEQFK